MEITELLNRWCAGDKTVEARLFALLQPELHAIAVRQLKRQKHATLRPTELTNEVLLQLHQGDFQFSHSKELYGLAARMIRFYVVDYHRTKISVKRGAEFEFVSLDGLNDQDAAMVGTHNWVEVSQAISCLEAEDARCGKLVELRFFLGNTIEEAAEVLSISTATAQRLWRFARAFLLKQLTEVSPADVGGSA